MGGPAQLSDSAAVTVLQGSPLSSLYTCRAKGSVVMFGGVDKSYCQGALSWVPLIHVGDWSYTWTGNLSLWGSAQVMLPLLYMDRGRHTQMHSQTHSHTDIYTTHNDTDTQKHRSTQADTYKHKQTHIKTCIASQRHTSTHRDTYKHTYKQTLKQIDIQKNNEFIISRPSDQGSESESDSEVAQSCSTLSDPMDCSLPGSSVHGIFQARVLEWGAIAFSSYCILG